MRVSLYLGVVTRGGRMWGRCSVTHGAVGGACGREEVWQSPSPSYAFWVLSP